MKRTMVAAALFALIALTPRAACASPSVSTHVVARTSGVEIAAQVLSHLKDVSIGTGEATVTLSIGGHDRPVRVGFGELGRGAAAHGGLKGLDLAALAAMPIVAAMFFRAVRFLTQLGR